LLPNLSLENNEKVGEEDTEAIEKLILDLNNIRETQI
jgi:hypothetical protein